MHKFKMLNFEGIEIKADIEKRTIQGYASVFGNIDSHRDIIVEGAFTKTLNDWKNCNPKKRRVKVLWQHDRWEPIGKPLQMEQDSKGLLTDSYISPTPTGDKTLILAKDGILNEMSIGFNSIIEEYNREEKLTYIKEIKLWEYSVVTWASNSLATIDSVKDMKHLINEYAYSEGNILDIMAEAIFEKVNALKNEPKPSDDTYNIDKSLQDSEIQEIMNTIKKAKGEL